MIFHPDIFVFPRFSMHNNKQQQQKAGVAVAAGAGVAAGGRLGMGMGTTTTVKVVKIETVLENGIFPWIAVGTEIKVVEMTTVITVIESERGAGTGMIVEQAALKAGTEIGRRLAGETRTAGVTLLVLATPTTLVV